MASEVIEELQNSKDALERDLGAALLKWQEEKANQGFPRSMGYEPRDIRSKGAVAVIEACVLQGSSGFGQIDQTSSYEAIVDRHPDKFRDEVVTAARVRLQSGQTSNALISSADLRMIASSRNKEKYADLSESELAAYASVTEALEGLAKLQQSSLPNPDNFEVRLTSGFNIKSGVRGYIPKDLWFSVSPKQNAGELGSIPQLFMIVSERGIEYGYGASVSPSDFSQQSVKEIVRKAAPTVFDKLPAPTSSEVIKIRNELDNSGGWYFRRKHRLPPNQNDYPNFDDWLSYLKSNEGKKNAAGTISRYLIGSQVDQTDLRTEMAQTAHLFLPLLDRDWGGAAESPTLSSRSELDKDNATAEFARLLTRFLKTYERERSGPFRLSDDIRVAMTGLRDWIVQSPPVLNRPNIQVEISVGKGVWTKTPWIALLDKRVTTTTQEGTYVVFLVAEDLSVTYLTLNQGMTELRNRLKEKGAAEEMVRVAEAIRPSMQELKGAGFILDNGIKLMSGTSAARSYEIGTIAHVALPSDDLPTDRKIEELLEDLLSAYHRVVETSPEVQVFDVGSTPEITPPSQAERYQIDDALDELFLERSDLERYLDIWANKKNMILQGAPGVGKSFVARRLAYALIGFRDDTKIQTVQFHQSYSYEDFVQGYRPNDNQGFERKNGTFHEFRDRALLDPDSTYVFIIDEINRGNLSKIFGELMLLIEPDKRGADWKTRLAYATNEDPEFYVPDNLFVLGMMNTADRSLSLVDYALRRRFAFVSMEPLYSAPKFRVHLQEAGVAEELITRIINGMTELNQAIESDRTNLGPGFRVGHSFFTPTKHVDSPEAWYRRVVETEIHPLLEEYWFDAPETADQWCDKLLK